MAEAERARFPIVVHTLLVQADSLFLLRRANSSYLNGVYTLPGGHMRIGESVLDAARRETLEEAGVAVELADLQLVATLPYRAGEHQGVDFIARAERWQGEPRIAEPEHFDDCCWASEDALPEPVAPYVEPLLDMLARGEWFRELND